MAIPLLNGDAILSIDEVAIYLNISPKSARNRMSLGKPMPPWIQIESGGQFWRRSTVENWLCGLEGTAQEHRRRRQEKAISSKMAQGAAQQQLADLSNTQKRGMIKAHQELMIVALHSKNKPTPVS